MMDAPAESNWSLTCTLREWEFLHSQLLFVFDNPIPNGTADGTYERHGEYSAWLVRKGSARVVCDGQEQVVRAGQWLVIIGREIQQRLSPDIHLLSLRMVGRWLDEKVLFGGPSMLLLEADDHPHLEPLAKQLLADIGYVASRPESPSYTYLWRHRVNYLDYCRYQRHQFEWFEAIAQIMQANGMTIQIPRRIDPRLAAALFVIDNLSSRAPFPARELAAAGGLTIGQLNRLCLSAHNRTLYGYWEQRRIDQARLLLSSADPSVKEIAFQLGFSQLSHFSAWFKRHTGQSPRHFHQS